MVDEIYNLACPASPIHCQYDPVQTTKTSVHGAINMLGLAVWTKGCEGRSTIFFGRALALTKALADQRAPRLSLVP